MQQKQVKSKFLLSVIILSAIAGGTISFNVMDLTKVVYVHKTGDPATKCTVPFLGVTTIPNESPVVINATTSSTLPCTIKTFYLTD